MYNIKVVKAPNKDGRFLFIENNKIYFETEEELHKFLILLLKETGRIGF